MIPTNDWLSFSEFCNRLKEDGAYIGEDGHVYRKDGRPLSRLCRNGYYAVRKMYDTHCYTFMEHRVVWYFVHGSLAQDKVINHKDFDRGNNRIENLELISQKDNVKWSKTHGRYPSNAGCENGRAALTKEEVQAIRYLARHGWEQYVLAEMFGAKNPDLISRVVTGTRYGNVEDASSILAIYPTIVMKTSNRESFRETLSNIGLGLTGEAGEVADILKKYLHHRHDLDVNELILELGDVLYYICWLCLQIGVDFSELCFENMEKLNARYPNGFDSERSVHRPEYEGGSKND